MLATRTDNLRAAPATTVAELQDTLAERARNYYLVHWDEVSPSCSLIEHARKDAPGYYVGGSTAIGAIAGAVLSGKGKRAQGAAIGAFAGFIFGFLTL